MSLFPHGSLLLNHDEGPIAVELPRAWGLIHMITWTTDNFVF